MLRLRRRPFRFFLIFVGLAVCLMVTARAQSIGGESVFPNDSNSQKYNPYADHTGASASDYQHNVKDTYDGEFMLMMIRHRWSPWMSNHPDNISFSVQLLSFPFVPDPNYSDRDTRVLTLPTGTFQSYPQTTAATGDGWALPKPVGGTFPLWRAFHTGAQWRENLPQLGNGIPKAFPVSSIKAKQDIPLTVPDNPMSLISNFFERTDFCNPDAIMQPGIRTHLPHSIFRLTINLHAGNWQNSDVIDSLSFITDNTRGRMRDYPFVANNCDGSHGSVNAHDVTLFATHAYAEIATYADDQNAFDTINYYPYTYKANYPDYSPPPKNRSATADLPPELPTYAFVADYLHPPAFAVTGGTMRGAAAGFPVGYESSAQSTLYKMPGIEHRYQIRTNFDVRLLGPEVFNPPYVEVYSSNLEFPFGYTFRTPRNTLPTQAQVAAANTVANGGPYSDLRQVPVPSDLATPSTDAAVYALQPGSTLSIHQCVTIWDATFVVKPGATLVVHPQVKGRFLIDNQGGQVRYVRPASLPCPPPQFGHERACGIDGGDKIKCSSFQELIPD